VTTSIDLKEKINIHQFYWTVSLDKNNNFRFIPDVYNLDDELSDKLSN
jgi:murein L,D-transpeptidase YcbB/YkuD